MNRTYKKIIKVMLLAYFAVLIGYAGTLFVNMHIKVQKANPSTIPVLTKDVLFSVLKELNQRTQFNAGGAQPVQSKFGKPEPFTL